MNGVVLPIIPGRQNCRLARNINRLAFSFTITLCEVYPYLQRYGHDGPHHSNYPFVAKYCVTMPVIFVIGFFIVVVRHCKFYENVKKI